MTALTIPEVLDKIHDLPSLPLIVLELLNSIDNEDIDMKTLALKVSQDQALSAKTLRLANSSFYGVSHTILTISQSISVLGFQTVRTLVTAAAVIGTFPGQEQSTFNLQAFWRHSLATAVCAKALARHLRANEEHAYLAGLLHDIGRLVLVTCFPENYNAVVAYRERLDCYLFEAEQEILKIDHARVGRALAIHWKFPTPMQRAVADHHFPDQNDPSPIAAIVHVADAITHALDLSNDMRDLVPPLSAAILDKLGVTESMMMQVLGGTEAQFGEASQILAG